MEDLAFLRLGIGGVWLWGVTVVESKENLEEVVPDGVLRQFLFCSSAILNDATKISATTILGKD